MLTPLSSGKKSQQEYCFPQYEYHFVHKKLTFENSFLSPSKTTVKQPVAGTPQMPTNKNCMTPSLQLKMKKSEPQSQSQSNKRKSSFVQSGQKVITCNCKKTQCLKLYCDCFANGRVCGRDCNCRGCNNKDVDQQERIYSTAKKGFQPKIETMQLLHQHFKGCNCKKSNCQKNYCECFQAGVECSELCHCIDCKNAVEVEESE